MLLNDPLPAGLSAAGVVSTTEGTCNAATLCSIGTLGSGEAVTVTIQARVNADVAEGAIITNSADVSGAIFDDNPLNNSAPEQRLQFTALPPCRSRRSISLTL